MSVIDTRRDQLAALAAAGAPQAAVDAALALLAMRENIGRQQWRHERERREHAQADAAAATVLADVVREEDQRADADREAALAAHEDERRARVAERRQLRDTIDVERLRESDDAREVLSLVADANAASPVLGAEATRIAVQRIRPLAAREKHQLGGGPWFRALCRLTAAAAPQDATRSDIGDRFDARKRTAREQVLRVAGVVGIRALTEKAFGATSQPAPADRQRPAMVVGPFFERHPQLARLGQMRSAGDDVAARLLRDAQAAAAAKEN